MTEENKESSWEFGSSFPIKVSNAREINWIKASDIPPPKDKPFLGYVKLGYHCDGLKDDRDRDIQTCFWHNFYEKFMEACNCSGYERDYEYIEVTHWMPLPEPPED